MKYKSTTVGVAVLLLLIGLSYLICKEENGARENRTMATFTAVFKPSIDSVTYRETALERFEEALKDQFFTRDLALDIYLGAENLASNAVSSIYAKLYRSTDDSSPQYMYEEIGSYMKIDGTDWICDKPYLDEVEDMRIQLHIEQIERLHRMYPQMKFYFYSVTQASNTGWFNDFLGVSVPDLYKQIIGLMPEYVKCSRLEYDNLEDYQTCHYKTDHHWNEKGAQRGYEDIYDMMDADLDLPGMRVPERKISFSELYGVEYKGSYARNLGSLYSAYDDFSVYAYELPARTVYVIDPQIMKEIQVSELSLWKEYLGGEIDEDADHYISFYGSAIADDGTVYNDRQAMFMIKNDDPETDHNLLIFGDSYNRALRDVLASHFGTTVYLQRDIMTLVDIDVLIEKYDIDTFLISGSPGLLTVDEYIFPFADEEG